MQRPSLTLLSLALISAQAIAQPATHLPQLGSSPISEVIAAMTAEEKVSLLLGAGMDVPGLPEHMKGPVVGEIKGKVPGAAGSTVAVARLGIPAITMADGPAGVRIQAQRPKDTASYYATAFPIGTALASTWDLSAVRRVGAAIGHEAKEYGVDILLAPAMNLQRNPLGGRNFEYYAEDPVLSGEIAAAYVNGVQSKGVGTSIKHFALNNHETNRDVLNVKINERPMRELYLRSFQIANQKSQPWTVMSSYNQINGSYTSESRDLLTQILRQEWGFKGLVMTDWFAGKNPVAQVQAGNDLLMPGTAWQQKALLEALRNKTLDESVLNQNVAHILSIIERTPSFKKYAYSNRPDLKADARIAREVAADGVVLLKNQQALPFAADIRSVALFGNSAYDTIKGGTGSGDVHAKQVVALSEGLNQAGYQLNPQLRTQYQQYLERAKAERPAGNPMMLPPPIAELDWRTHDSQMIARMAKDYDTALVVIGRNSGEFADRKLAGDFELTEVEQQLIRDVSQQFKQHNKKTSVILNVGGAIETASWRDTPDAIVLAWQLGQESGNAIADVLRGKVNPSGKLTTTWPKRYDDLPSAHNFPGTVLIPKDPNNHNPMAGDQAAEIEYSDGMRVGYRHFDQAKENIAYPFGHGLSYTQFRYDDLKVSASPQGSVKIQLNVRNIGSSAGKEAVQIYIGAPSTQISKPLKELKAFGKTRLLRAGEQQNLSFTLSARDLASFYSERSSWIADAGRYTVYAGASAQDIRARAEFDLGQAIVTERTQVALRPAQAIADKP